jgi:hypothetical protein
MLNISLTGVSYEHFPDCALSGGSVGNPGRTSLGRYSMPMSPCSLRGMAFLGMLLGELLR